MQMRWLTLIENRFKIFVLYVILLRIYTPFINLSHKQNDIILPRYEWCNRYTTVTGADLHVTSDMLKLSVINYSWEIIAI